MHESAYWGHYILRGHPSHVKVQPPAGQREYYHFSVILRPWVLVRPRESNPQPPALQSSALPTELILPWFLSSIPNFLNKQACRILINNLFHPTHKLLKNFWSDQCFNNISPCLIKSFLQSDIMTTKIKYQRLIFCSLRFA